MIRMMDDWNGCLEGCLEGLDRLEAGARLGLRPRKDAKLRQRIGVPQPPRKS